MALAASCSKAPLVNVEVTTGQEKGALSLDPKVVRIDIAAATPDGKTVLKASAGPGESFDLGEAPDNAPLQFKLTGYAADGTTVLARGQSVSIPIGSIALGTLPLFIQRVAAPGFTGLEFARPPGSLVRTHVRGVAAVFQERYLLLTGGDSAADASGPQSTQLGDFYDLLAGDGALGGTFTRNAGAMVVRGNTVLVVDKDGATWLDLSTDAKTEATIPDGIALADVVGGRAIDTPSGATWIVGATRDADPPTSAILVVGADSTLTARNLTAPRNGAAAAWIGGALVVAGGNADAKGVETFAETAAAASPGGFPNDPTKGAAIAILKGATTQAILIGGTLNGAAAPTRVLDLEGCSAATSACMPLPIDQATINADGSGAPLVLASRSQAFAVKVGNTAAYLVVGDDAAGQTHAFRVDPNTPSVTELPLHEPRLGATAIPAPNGTLAIMGGQLLTGGPALSVELYNPDPQ